MLRYATDPLSGQVDRQIGLNHFYISLRAILFNIISAILRAKYK